ncbi:MAG: hypothetical protein HYX76_00010 [Acidobacteria bacterium]|nr:hypothetical protein [Acidobacteriota bacterium]
MRTAIPAFVLLLVFAFAATSCSDGVNPTSPTVTAPPAVAEQTAPATAGGLTGVVRGLDVQARSFTVTTRAESRAIRTDDRTEVWSGGSRVRFGALRDGMVVGIRALDYGSFALARTISIMR